MSPVGLFVLLFRGRGDAYGSWEGPRAVRAPLNHDLFERHLYGGTLKDWIGVYDVLDHRCSWGCVDIDDDDLPLARNVRMSLWRQDIPAWIEKTRRGYHVWVFPEDGMVEAATMRQALTAACLAVGYSPKEVYPKQTRVSGSQLGNWVRLPFNGWFHPEPEERPRQIIDIQDVAEADYPFEALMRRMHDDRAHTADLERAASYLPDPQLVNISVDFTRGLEVESTVQHLGGMVLRLWRDGPRFGHDRSGTLARLAHFLREDDVDPSTALAIITSADNRWGKGYLGRGEAGQHILLKLIETTYGKGAYTNDVQGTVLEEL